jgi:hypothetical protein
MGSPFIPRRPLSSGRRPPSRRAAAAVAVVLAIAACSGGASSPPGVGADFAQRVRVVCQHALELKQAQGPFPVASFNPTDPDVTKFAEVAVALRVTDATWTTWLTEMRALGTPSTGQSAWSDLVAAVERHQQINADQISAAERGDAAAFSADYDLGVQTQAALLKAAEAAGVPECAKVDR